MGGGTSTLALSFRPGPMVAPSSHLVGSVVSPPEFDILFISEAQGQMMPRCIEIAGPQPSCWGYDSSAA